jgi:hypothetical protein
MMSGLNAVMVLDDSIISDGRGRRIRMELAWTWSGGHYKLPSTNEDAMRNTIHAAETLRSRNMQESGFEHPYGNLFFPKTGI